MSKKVSVIISLLAISLVTATSFNAHATPINCRVDANYYDEGFYIAVARNYYYNGRFYSNTLHQYFTWEFPEALANYRRTISEEFGLNNGSCTIEVPSLDPSQPSGSWHCNGIRVEGNLYARTFISYCPNTTAPTKP
jgi:hypothetical protein